MRDRNEMEMLRAPWQIADCARETPVLLALSGGADSRFLLHVLVQFAKRDGFSLTLAHVNHEIRGEESIRDRDFCVSLAEQYGLEIEVLDVDVPKLAKDRGTGLEETAREVRYRFFEELMQRRGIPLLVTAHHADDNAETVIFRMARGSGLQGLGGIAPIRPFASGMLVRPMLNLCKREIVEYCNREGLQYVTDNTNFDTAYARNRIRADVLPVLEELFSGATERISAMTAQLRADEALLSEMADRFVQAHCTEGCPVSMLLAEPQALQGRILSAWIAKACGISLERVHVEALLCLCKRGEAHSAQTLPQGVTVALKKGNLCVTSGNSVETVDYRIPFCEGEMRLGASGWSACVQKCEKNRKIHNLSTAPYIFLKGEFDIMKKETYWRPRRAGDRVLMGGMHREVRKLYREAAMPLEMRANLPILCDADGIVWIPFVGARDGAEEKNRENSGLWVTLCHENQTF